MSEATNNIIVRSVNISEEKGTIKIPVDSGLITTEGIKGDAHSGPWHRQISLLAVESLHNFKEKAGREIEFGEFAENLTLEGINLTQVGLLDRFSGNHFEIEVTQIGKKCHGDGCAIFQEVGKCAMPKEGLFCRVIQTGEVKPGDHITYKPRTFKALLVTLSDRASRGDYKDKSGSLIKEQLDAYLEKSFNRYQIEQVVIPDEQSELTNLVRKAKGNNFDLLITTGGTGIGSRDITPDTLQSFIDKPLPGIMEMIRVKYGWDNPNALLSRSIAGVSGKMLVYALPGSTKAVKEYLEVIIPTLRHSYYMVNDLDIHH